MRPSVKVVAALAPAVISALVLPEATTSPGSERAGLSHGITPIVHSQQRPGVDIGDASFARLQVRRQCLPQNDGTFPDSVDLEFNLRALAAPDLCGYGYITVNDLLLPQEATSLSSWGQGLVPAANANSGAVHAVNAEWEFSCLFAPPDSERDQLHQQDDAARAQFMVFKIKDIDGHALPCGQVGFTVSYKQSAVPQLFRIESEAYPVPDAHSTRDWMASPSPDAAPVESPSLDEGETELSEFEVQVRELQRLKAEAEELRKVMKEQQRVVWRHFKAELKGLQGEIDQCEDIRCTINTAFQKAHWAIKTVCGGFRPAHQESRTSPRPEEVVEIGRAHV